jgi:thiamine-phosphate pyrophosphorylase
MNLPAFYPVLDTGACLARGLDPVTTARQILDGGARILQFRHKQFLSRQAYGWLELIAQHSQNSGALLVVNDRADLAALFHAALHVGQDDLPPSAARRLFNGALGLSTHNESQLRAAADEPLDYIALGPILATGTKENPDATVGVAELARLRPRTTRPLVAIGGITRANAESVREAGADSVAVIADLFPDDGCITRRTADWMRLLS